MVLTEAGVDDAEVVPALLTETKEEIEQLSADGAYDKRKVYEAALRRQVAKLAIPPRHGARIWQHGNGKVPRLPRDTTCGGFGRLDGDNGNARVITINVRWPRPLCFASKQFLEII